MTEEVKYQQEPMSLLEETKAAIEELKKANADKKALIEREERLKASELLGGRTQAGFDNKPKVMTPKEYKDAIMRGEVPQ